MKRSGAWLAGGGLILSAGLISSITPTELDVVAPFDVHGGADERIASRTLVAQDATWSFAERLTDGEDWTVEGNWLVVELTASARYDEVGAEIGLASLEVDGRVFHASERLPSSLLRTPLRLSVGTTGALAFELPDGVRAGSAALKLSPHYATAPLDDLIVIPIALGDAAVRDVIEVAEPEVVAR